MLNFDFLRGDQESLMERPEWMEDVPAPEALPIRQRPARTQPSTMEILQAALGRSQTPDFRGMTPEQIQRLQTNQQAQQAQRLGIANAIIGQQAARRKAQRERDVAAVERIQEDQAAAQKQQHEMDKVRLEDQLGRKLTPLERRKMEADIGALNALTKKREAIAAAGGLTPYQQLTNVYRNAMLDINKARNQREIKAAEAKRNEARNELMRNIVASPTDDPQAQQAAEQLNRDPDATEIVYADEPWIGGNTWKRWRIPDDLEFNGEAATAPMLVERARAAEMDLGEFLKKLKEQLYAD